jgi:DNA-binding MarR family transcriptional regulator
VTEPSRLRVLWALKENPGSTVRDLAALLHLSPSTVQVHLNTLKAKGEIRRVACPTCGHLRWGVA